MGRRVRTKEKSTNTMFGRLDLWRLRGFFYFSYYCLLFLVEGLEEPLIFKTLFCSFYLLHNNCIWDMSFTKKRMVDFLNSSCFIGFSLSSMVVARFELFFVKKALKLFLNKSRFCKFTVMILLWSFSGICPLVSYFLPVNKMKWIAYLSQKARLI